MKALGDFLHGKGLKFGLYSSAGTHTCEHRAGGISFEELDVKDYAKWGVDYLKYDNCGDRKGKNNLDRYTVMAEALKKYGSKIYYSICNWGEEDVGSWAAKISNSWRVDGDIDWPTPAFENVRRAIGKSESYRSRAGPGAWNDPDMLEVGNNKYTLPQEFTHFSLWAIGKAPLLIGCDLSSITKESLAILKNKNLIDIH